MSGCLQGKVALVTGASRGIGRAIAQRLSAEGATVAVVARSLSGDLLNTVSLIEAAGGRAFPIAADISDDTLLRALPEQVQAMGGRLDILVNNAGSAHYASFGDLPIAAIDAMMGSYLRAPILLAQAVLPVMRRNGAGWIVNIGSITALPPAIPFTAGSRAGQDCVYAALKAGLVRFTQGLAAALLDENIAVNMASPSTAIRTPGADALLPADYPTERVEYLAETVLALCHRPAAERTGLTAFSMHYPAAEGLTVRGLDGRETLPPPVPPQWRYPATPVSGTELMPHLVSED
ncbi:oxidoreductase [Croceicoccus estronivorus]|uniref:SDR family NAD(P)-dependent oxidoreductase n=1 Tax=Croceicoccus estronivorus TaxID=1172626 RepID=UPI000836FDB9|nr:SDR family NAD(P)-dependent oxidoreductase [Croceicoccus estronivorus]OCC24388.1 oxidoreductase [Croceicoccus estronivorus]